MVCMMQVTIYTCNNKVQFILGCKNLQHTRHMMCITRSPGTLHVLIVQQHEAYVAYHDGTGTSTMVPTRTTCLSRQWLTMTPIK
jgi:hypothetical protein